MRRNLLTPQLEDQPDDINEIYKQDFRLFKRDGVDINKVAGC